MLKNLKPIQEPNLLFKIYETILWSIIGLLGAYGAYNLIALYASLSGREINLLGG